MSPSTSRPLTCRVPLEPTEISWAVSSVTTVAVRVDTKPAVGDVGVGETGGSGSAQAPAGSATSTRGIDTASSSRLRIRFTRNSLANRA